MFNLAVRILVLVIVFFSLVGCETTGGGNKENTGTGIGVAVGAVTGVLLGGSSTTGKVLGGVIGATAGGIIGKQIGKHLDEKDQEKLAASTQQALNTGESQAWQNPDTGVKADVLVKDVEPAPASEAKVASTNSSDTPLCREVTQNVTLKDGSTKTETITACKGPNGWEMM